MLQAKDGLALVSANGVSVGQGALVAERARALADAAETVAALSMEATRGNPSIALPVVADGKPFPGLAESCRQLRAALAGSYLWETDAPASVQDPLSFRVVPQVHGAFRDTLTFAAQAVETELNAQADNPLVSPSDGTLVSNGNFHPVLLAVAFDALRVAIAHVGQLSDRRLSHLWSAFFAAMSAGGPPSSDGPPPDLPGMHLRYPAAAAYAELRQLADPVSLDVGVLDKVSRTTPPTPRSASAGPTRRSTCWPTCSRSSCCSPPTSSTWARSSPPSARGRGRSTARRARRPPEPRTGPAAPSTRRSAPLCSREPGQPAAGVPEVPPHSSRVESRPLVRRHPVNLPRAGRQQG